MAEKIYPIESTSVAFAILLMAIAIAVKLTNIQWVEGSYYRQLAKRTVRILLFLPKAIFILQMEVY
jgi:hypothetical protein